jgi:hypothetical protein
MMLDYLSYAALTIVVIIFLALAIRILASSLHWAASPV